MSETCWGELGMVVTSWGHVIRVFGDFGDLGGREARPPRGLCTVSSDFRLRMGEDAGTVPQGGGHRRFPIAFQSLGSPIAVGILRMVVKSSRVACSSSSIHRS